MVVMLGRPCAMAATGSGSNPRSAAHRLQTRATAGVESMSTPSMSNSSAQQLIFSTDWMINDRPATPSGESNVSGWFFIRRSEPMETKAEWRAKAGRQFLLRVGFLIIVGGVLLLQSVAHAQGWQEPGRSIGKISTEGNLIVMELDEGALGKANLFDLVGHTLRFIPDGQGYRVENVALQWDREYGAEISGFQVSLHNFKFPFSGKEWDAFSIGRNGSIVFGERTGVDRTGEGA